MRKNNAVEGTQGDTLYYDGACPLCSKEIAKLSEADAGGLRCIDVSSDSFVGPLDSLAGPSKEDMLRRLHVRTWDGHWLVGLRANVYAWRNTPYAKFWRILTLPLVFPLASAAYELWAKIRFKHQRNTTS